MGTRADFWVGLGPDAEWLGSVGWDGYEFEGAMRRIKSVEGFRRKVERIASEREDWTDPAKSGWPWPWDDSGTTDFAYWWDTDNQRVVISTFSHIRHTKKTRELFERKGIEEEVWWEMPNMDERKDVTYGPRSGLVVITGGGV